MADCIVIGGGPAGLMAAEVLSSHGQRVTLYDRMPSVGRKLLIAGRGGLNLTHSESMGKFVSRYGGRAEWIRSVVEAFPPEALVAWAHGLGQETFVGSSGRIFPKSLKASPLLRAWLKRLADQGVAIETRRTWLGWDEEGRLLFRDALGAESSLAAEAVVLALGGASWPKLGARGDWAPFLQKRGVLVHPFLPANCGFNVSWSAPMLDRFAGQPLQGAAYEFEGERVRGESVITQYGIEGGAIYALSSRLRDRIAANGSATLMVDLRPEMPLVDLIRKLSRPRAGDSMSNALRKLLNLAPVGVSLLREVFGKELGGDATTLSRQIKAVPIRLTGVQGLERAISSAGGVAVEELDAKLMLRKMPGVFLAGEMIDWEAPTGGYLLQACFATGVAAANGIVSWLKHGGRG